MLETKAKKIIGRWWWLSNCSELHLLITSSFLEALSIVTWLEWFTTLIVRWSGNFFPFARGKSLFYYKRNSLLNFCIFFQLIKYILCCYFCFILAFIIYVISLQIFSETERRIINRGSSFGPRRLSSSLWFSLYG